MDNLFLTLKNMSPVQMVLAWCFVACYALALGGMLESKGSLRAGVAALLAGLLFVLFSDPWVHGALLVLFGVAGMGAFVTVSWALTYGTAWLIQRRHGAPAQALRASSTTPPAGTGGVLRALWRSFSAS